MVALLPLLLLIGTLLSVCCGGEKTAHENPAPPRSDVDLGTVDVGSSAHGWLAPNWLSVLDHGPGWASILVSPHVNVCQDPLRRLFLDGREIGPIYMPSFAFVVRAPPGPHVVRVEEFCTSSSLDIVIE